MKKITLIPMFLAAASGTFAQAATQNKLDSFSKVTTILPATIITME